MSVNDHITAFAQGWTEGDIAKVMESLSSDFTLDDPNGGTFAKGDMPDYFDALVASVAQLRGEQTDAPLMEMSEVVVNSDQSPTTVWAWWTVPGTPLSGSALVKVSEEGVVSERLTYSTALGAS